MNKSTYKVLKNLQDGQNNLAFYAAGEPIELTEARGKELTDLGFVVKVKAKNEPDEEISQDAAGEPIELTEAQKPKGKTKNEAK